MSQATYTIMGGHTLTYLTWDKISISGPPFQVELGSSKEGGAGEYHGSKLGLYEMMPANMKRDGQRVYRQLHDGNIKQSYLFR